MPLKKPQDALDEGFDKMDAGDIAGAREIALRYLAAPEATVSRRAHKLAGLCCFHQQNMAEALTYFEKAAAGSDDAADWFNVLSAATLGKNIARGKEAFDKAVACQVAAKYRQQPSIPYLHLYFGHALCDVGEFSLALEQVEALGRIYADLKITDDTFLHIRGVPFLSHGLRMADCAFAGLGDKSRRRGFLSTLAKNLDEDGQAYIQELD